MATVVEVMAKLNGNASSMIGAFNDAKKAASGHASSTASSADSTSSALAGMATKAVAALGGIALAYSAAQGAMAQRAQEGNLIASFGLSAEDAATAATVAGNVYSESWGESLGEVVSATGKVGTALGGVTDKARLGGLTRDALAFASAFDVEVVDSLNAAQTMVKTGLSPSIEAAYEVMAAGAQKGLNANGDLFETLNEYGTQFAKVGIDGAQAMGLISQGMKAGARDTDYISDAIKEFSIRAIDGSKATSAGFKAIGLDAEDMSAKIAGGGPVANEALATVLDKLRGMKDPAEQAAAATALFGTKAEDLGQSLFALDPRTAAAGLGEITGSMDKVRDGMTQAVTPIDALKRQFETTLTGIGVAFLPAIDSAASFGADMMSHMEGIGPAITNVGNFITGTLVPALQQGAQWMTENGNTVTGVAALIGAVMLPVFIRLTVAAGISAAAQVAAWATSGAGAVKTSIMYVVASYAIMGAWIRQGAAAIASGAVTVAIWALYAAEAIKGAAISAVNAARVVAGWVLMGVQSMIHAARMAAAWFIALGPIGWVIAIVIGLVAIIIANWDAISTWTAQAWNNIVGFVVAAWEAIVAWVVGAVTAVVTPIVDGFNAMLAFIMAIFTAIGAFISGVWTWIFSLLMAIGQAFWAEHGAQLTAAWEFIVATFTAIFEFYVAIWTAIITFIIEAVTNIVNGIVLGFTTAWTFIQTVVQAINDFIVMIFTAVWTFVVTVFTAISEAISTAWNFIMSVTSTIVNAISSVVMAVFNAVWGFISGIFTTIFGFLAGIWNSIYATIAAAVASVWSTVVSGFNGVWNTITSIFNQVVGFLGGIWSSITGGVSSTIGQIGSAFASIWGIVTGALSGAGSWLLSAGVSVVQGFINGVKSLAGTIGNAFLSMVPGWIVGPFKAALGIASPSKLFGQFGKWIIQGLGIGIESEESTAVNAMTGAARAVEQAGSGISIKAPRIETPRIPKLDTSSLTIDPITVSVMLDASAFEATAKSLRIGGVDGGVRIDTGAAVSPMARGYSGEQQAPVQQTFIISNYNPVAEPTSKTVEKAQDLAALTGAF